MAIEPTILSEFLPTPEMAADTANPRGSQDFSRFLNAVTPEGATAANPTPPAVGNPTPPITDAAQGPHPDGEDIPTQLQAMLTMADQLGLEAKPASTAAKDFVAVPNRAPAKNGLKDAVSFAASVVGDGALPEASVSPAQGEGAEAADDDANGDAARQHGMDAPLPQPIAHGALAPLMPGAPQPPASAAANAELPVRPQAGSAPTFSPASQPAAVPLEVAAAAQDVSEAPATPAGAEALPMLAERADTRMRNARGHEIATARLPAAQPSSALARAMPGLEALVAPLPDARRHAADVPVGDVQPPATMAEPQPRQPDAASSAQPATAPTLSASAPAPAPGHQQVLEDLLVGHAVDEQWVDRLSRDVQALVASDNREARLHLRPRELGDLAIRLNIADGQAKVHFTVESAAAQALIAEAVPRLQSMMESKGFRLDQAAVDVGGQGTGAGRNGAGAGQADGQRTEPASMARAPAAAVEAAVRAAARQTAFERYA